MCGLLGFAGLGAGLDETKVFKELLWCSSLRGIDSTGVASVKNTQNFRNPLVQLRKETISSPNFIFGSQRDKGSWIHSGMHDVLMGHCRDATRGAVTEKNAHPFKFGDIVGAHNGTIHDSDYFIKGRSDSEILFENMSQKGVLETLDDIWWGGWAVSVWDNSKKRLYLGRNKERPLFMAVSKKTSVLFWASELGMLSSILERGEKRSYDVDYYDLEADVIYEFDLQKIDKNNPEPWIIHQLSEKKRELPQMTVERTITQNSVSEPWKPPTFLTGGTAFDECITCGTAIPLSTRCKLEAVYQTGKGMRYECLGCNPDQVQLKAV